MDTIKTFHNMGIDVKIADELEKSGITVPTPIQEKAVPLALAGSDVIGIAKTGTGKTLAFGIPLIQGIYRYGGKALIVVPVRELAMQVDEALEKICDIFGIKTAVLIGGADMENQVSRLSRNPSIITATPGRLIDHMHRGSVTTADVSYLVLDEADRMLDLGFAREVSEILRNIPKHRQTFLFSATMPADIIKIAETHMNNPVTVEISPSGTAAELVEQELYVIREEAKKIVTADLLSQHSGPVLVFTRTKKGASIAARAIKRAGFTAAEIHSDRGQSEREKALTGFKSGKYRVLVATDIAARGIDVTGIELVINYDLPDEALNYIHRIGRTGRAGKRGKSVTLATPEQAAGVKSIEKIMNKEIPVLKHEAVQNEEFMEIPFNSPHVNPMMLAREKIKTRDVTGRKKDRAEGISKKEKRWT